MPSTVRLPYFNPHSHAGSDQLAGLMVKMDNDISIHTPTQGVTLVLIFDSLKSVISIHTPTQGVTVIPGIISRAEYISIHTPTQGVTRNCWNLRLGRIYFNPHSHAGSDEANEGRNRVSHYFNPHSHAGSDFTEINLHRGKRQISIHTPTQGVT